MRGQAPNVSTSLAVLASRAWELCVSISQEAVAGPREGSRGRAGEGQEREEEVSPSPVVCVFAIPA